MTEKVTATLHAWGGITWIHDYRLSTGEIATLHQDKDFYFEDGRRYVRPEALAEARRVNSRLFTCQE
jgi:hypothetical protein